MKGVRLDHATINTDDVKASVAFYGHFLDLKPGWRPDFGVGGAWLYAADGDYPILHLLEMPRVEGVGMFNHVAFRGEGLQAYLAKLKAARCWYDARPVDQTPYTQVHHFDPNDVRLEVIFEEPLGADRVMSDDGIVARSSVLDSPR
jgi:catechol 2,3-dioxygenase-like lactoylglutathione lyase family enzyme